MKFFLRGIFLFLFLFLMQGSTFAQEDLFWGQEHNYSVVFRGNGEAIVYVKIDIENNEEESLKQFDFIIPNITPSELMIYQGPVLGDTLYKSYLIYNNDEYLNSKYTKLEYENTGESYSATLATSVAQNRSTDIVMAYTTKEYVKESLGMYKYEFETIKVASRIKEIKVAIDVDSDLYLKGDKLFVNYKKSNTSSSSPAMWRTNLDSASTTKMYDVISGIGSRGDVNKEATFLSPNESLTLKGAYSDSWFRINLNGILSVILIVVTIFGGSYFISKYLRKRRESRVVTQKVDSTTLDQQSKRYVPLISPLNIGIGLLSAALVVGYTLLFEYITDSDFLNLGYRTPVIYSILLVIVNILFYLILIFLPGIFVAIKNGWKSFLVVIISEFLWFLVFLVFLIVANG